MIQKDFYYRVLSSAQFEHSQKERAIIPVRLKTPFQERDEYFDEKNDAWLPLSPENTQKSDFDGIFAEYTAPPLRPKPLNFSEKNVEDMPPEKINALLLRHNAVKKWHFDKQYYTDEDGIKKDFVEAAFESDFDVLTLSMEFIFFEHDEKTPETPRLQEHGILFDVKNGTISFSNIDKWKKDDEEDDTAKKAMEASKSRNVNAYSFLAISIFLQKIEVLLPKSILLVAWEKLILLAEKYTRFSMQEQREKIPKKKLLRSLYKLTLLPFEPELCEVIYSLKAEHEKIRFKPRRNDSRVYNHFCKKMHIKSHRFLRRTYDEKPEKFLTYIMIKKCDFKDVNLYNRVLSDDESCKVFDWIRSNTLKTFCNYSIKKRGELATMNTLLKNSNEDFGEMRDAIGMFVQYFKFVPETLRKDILKDGFTSFNHDALSNIAFQAENKNVSFIHTEEEKKLEDSVLGYEFRLPESSWKLCEIGTALHNCVASYANSVKKKECTIVYATKDGEYKLCIEVRGNEIYQERADHNAKPDKEERAALDEWHARHRLILS